MRENVAGGLRVNSLSRVQPLSLVNQEKGLVEELLLYIEGCSYLL